MYTEQEEVQVQQILHRVLWVCIRQEGNISGWKENWSHQELQASYKSKRSPLVPQNEKLSVPLHSMLCRCEEATARPHTQGKWQKWTEEQEQAFLKFKEAVSKPEIMAYLMKRPRVKTSLTQVLLGCVLSWLKKTREDRERSSHTPAELWQTSNCVTHRQNEKR